MENKEKKLSEFDRYMVSPVIDEDLSTPQMYAGITIGLSYLFILSSIVFMFLSIFNKDLLNPDIDGTFYVPVHGNMSEKEDIWG